MKRFLCFLVLVFFFGFYLKIKVFDIVVGDWFCFNLEGVVNRVLRKVYCCVGGWVI